MRYVVTLFWAFILGQVISYIASSLAATAFDFKISTIVSLIAGVIIILIRYGAKPHTSSNQS
ncbi:YjzD family protein [Enterococcus sp. HY326]|uniref:YjzD family protein n=1 Tax=Enterococcus sp. HY326 TaxID=2971265 RepID=UPI00223F3392|nr:YjzD family protein [Enterococcus sp. HY326]